MKLFTIGHGNHGIDKMVGLLETNGIRTVVDVRSMPFSRYSPQFNKEDLDASLARARHILCIRREIPRR